jgi:hypothetical protein
MYLISSNEIEQLLSKGAVRQSHLVLKRHNWTTGRDDCLEDWDYIIYYWDVNGQELALFNRVSGCLQWFPTPRVWHQRHLDAQRFYRFSVEAPYPFPSYADPTTPRAAG